MRGKALVLGAGIQGISCALALQTNGYDVTIIDRSSEPFSRTSSRGEAKIHLGYVYANDPSFQTAELMIKSAMHFAPLLDTWTNHLIPWHKLRSNPFTYVVHKESMVSPDDLLRHYNRVADVYTNYYKEGLHYVGAKPDRLTIKPGSKTSFLNSSLVQTTIETQEVALQIALLKPALLSSLANKNSRSLMNRSVRAVERTSAGFRVTGETVGGQAWCEEGDLVVNCLWDGRLKLDASLDIKPNRKWVYRRKYRLLGHLPPELAHLTSYTIVLGPFGDLVTYPDGLTYLSWYPACLQGWSDELGPPDYWESANQLSTDHRLSDNLIAETLQAFEAIFPGLSRFVVRDVSAGIIFSWGETDIDDPNSQLHQRHNIGVNAFDGYFSIDTGKFTSAPLFAQSLLNHLNVSV